MAGLIASGKPPSILGVAPLMRMVFAGVDVRPLGSQLLDRATKDPTDAGALLDLSTLLQLRGQREIALSTQAQALQVQKLYRLPATGAARLRLLCIRAPGDLMANTPLEFLLEGSDVELNLLYLAPGEPLPATLPAHDLVFVAVGEREENRPLLRELEAPLRSWPVPVVNPPGGILHLSRDGACALLGSIPGMVMPMSARIDRQLLSRVGSGQTSIASIVSSVGDAAFPIIVRPVGSHAGHDLHKLEQPADIAAYLRSVPTDEFYVARFVDYRGTDGLFRKYRIALIKGQPFICHMAISEHWMIHYLNAGMNESAEKRAEEARFMECFDQDFARRHQAVFRTIAERMGLAYLGIDCGETSKGELLIFEVDSSMIVHSLDPVDSFPYKQAPMRKLFTAFRQMLSDALP